MSGKSKIEWTDATWNPIRGCSRVSEGCRNCYAERIADRFSGPGRPFEGVATANGWTGEVRLVESVLEDPLHWRKPRKIFVNSMSDLFHEKVQDDWLARIFGVMLQCPQHTFQVLTKRPVNMKHFMRAARRVIGKRGFAEYLMKVGIYFPPPNIWLGVSVEDQKTADERIPILLQTPAAVRWVSYEPALGPVDFTRIKMQEIPYARFSDDSGISNDRGTEPVFGNALRGDPRLDWIVCGGESGPGARPMHPDWVRAARDQCQAAGVPFFFKQWGEWIDGSEQMRRFSHEGRLVDRTDKCGYYCDSESVGHVDHGAALVMRLGKNKSGRLLDGREWNEFPPTRDRNRRQ